MQIAVNAIMLSGGATGKGANPALASPKWLLPTPNPTSPPPQQNEAL